MSPFRAQPKCATIRTLSPDPKTPRLVPIGPINNSKKTSAVPYQKRKVGSSHRHQRIATTCRNMPPVSSHDTCGSIYRRTRYPKRLFFNVLRYHIFFIKVKTNYETNQRNTSKPRKSVKRKKENKKNNRTIRNCLHDGRFRISQR